MTATCATCAKPLTSVVRFLAGATIQFGQCDHCPSVPLHAVSDAGPPSGMCRNLAGRSFGSRSLLLVSRFARFFDSLRRPLTITGPGYAASRLALFAEPNCRRPHHG